MFSMLLYEVAKVFFLLYQASQTSCCPVIHIRKWIGFLSKDVHVKSFNLTTHTQQLCPNTHPSKRSRSEQGVFVNLQTTVDFDRAGVLRKAETAHFLSDIHILRASAHASGLGEQLYPGRSVVLQIHSGKHSSHSSYYRHFRTFLKKILLRSLTLTARRIEPMTTGADVSSPSSAHSLGSSTTPSSSRAMQRPSNPGFSYSIQLQSVKVHH